MFNSLFRELKTLSPSHELLITTNVQSKGKLVKLLTNSRWLLFGLAPMLAVAAIIQSLSTGFNDEAQLRAKNQMGAEFADYKFFVRDIKNIYPNDKSHRVNIQVIAYPTSLDIGGDPVEVTVFWKVLQN
jgi:hypothetical protein